MIEQQADRSRPSRWPNSRPPSKPQLLLVEAAHDSATTRPPHKRRNEEAVLKSRGLDNELTFRGGNWTVADRSRHRDRDFGRHRQHHAHDVAAMSRGFTDGLARSQPMSHSSPSYKLVTWRSRRSFAIALAACTPHKMVRCQPIC